MNENKKQLEHQIKLLTQQIKELNKRVEFLERENRRRRLETNQIKG
jgi:regulator of replication initiation timing